MIELIQFAWSPFCLVQRRILEYSGAPFKTTDIPPSDRSRIWRLTRQRYYGVPVIKDGRTVVFETDEFSQIIAKYLDGKFQLNLFPKAWQGIDRMVWRNRERVKPYFCPIICGVPLSILRQIKRIGQKYGLTPLPRETYH